MLDSEMEQDQLSREFLLECSDGVDKLDQDLASLDQAPTNIEALSGVFRTFHTLESTAGFLAFPKLASSAHAAESLSIGTARTEVDVDCEPLLEDLGRRQQSDWDRRADRRLDR